MSDLQQPTPAGAAPRLVGWKEISGYFGRSVRSVQRWEIELSLPVHRVRGQDGQTVYAVPAELDAWLQSRDLSRNKPSSPTVTDAVPPQLSTTGSADLPEASSMPEADSQFWQDTQSRADAFPAEFDEPRRQRDSAEIDEHTEPADPTEGPAERPRSRAWSRGRIVRALVLATVVATTALLTYAWQYEAPSGPIVKVRAGGSEITAQDAFGNVLWRYPAGQVVSKPQDDAAGPPELFVDLDGDGANEIIVVVRYAPFGELATQSDAVLAFSRSGKLLWRYQPNVQLECGSEAFGAPWRIYAFMATSGPNPRVFVAMNHSYWWPGLVMELTPFGSASLYYLQNGWVRGLKEWPTRTSNFLAVTGVSNELKRPTVTLLNLDGVPASPPTRLSRFNCAQSPNGRPARIFALPNLELLDGASYAFAISPVLLQEHMMVDLAESSDGLAVADISSDLRTVSLSMSDSFWGRHLQAEHQRRVNHGLDACPAILREHSIDFWDPNSGWSSSMTKVNPRR